MRAIKQLILSNTVFWMMVLGAICAPAQEVRRTVELGENDKLIAEVSTKHLAAK